MYLLQQGLWTRYDDALFRFHIFVGFCIFWHVNYHLWSKELGHLPIICIIWIYYLTINPHDVQITWRTHQINIDVWIIPALYVVALDCIFTIAVGSILKIGAKCIYICTNSQNYQIVLIWSPNLHHCQIHINGSQIYITYPILNACKGITQISR